MNFFVERESNWHFNNCDPCDNIVERFILDDIPYIRRFYWKTEINSITELIDFVKEYGPIMITKQDAFAGYDPSPDDFRIKICDRWKE